MQNPTRRWIVWLSSVAIVLGLPACGAIPGLTDGTATPSPSPVFIESDGDSSALPPGQPGSPTTTKEPQGADDLPAGTDSCLVGTWQADSDSIAAFMQDAFTTNAQGKLDVQVSHTAGGLYITFADDGTMTMASDGAQFDVIIANLAEFNETVDAEGVASYAADGQYIAVWNPEYSSTGSGEGQVLSLPKTSADAGLTLTPDQLFAYAKSDPFEIMINGAPPTAHVAPYTCQGNKLISGPSEETPITWTRSQ